MKQVRFSLFVDFLGWITRLLVELFSKKGVVCIVLRIFAVRRIVLCALFRDLLKKADL